MAPRPATPRTVWPANVSPAASSLGEGDGGLRRDGAEREALHQVERDALGVVALVAHREVLARLEQEVAAALAEHDRALHARRPHERAAGDLAQVVEQRVAAVLAGLQHAGVGVRAERD